MKPLPSVSLALATLALLLSASCVRHPSATVKVLAAASLVDLMGDVTRAAHDSGLEVRCSFAASSQARAQIAHGAPADLFVSASIEDARTLVQEGLAEKQTGVSLYRNHLVVVAPVDGAVRALDDLRQRGRLALGDPRIVPAGRYAEQSLRHLDLWSALDGRRVLGADARVVLGWAARGEVDAAVVYETDSRSEATRLRVVTRLPDDSHAPIVYVAVVPRQADNREGAAAVLALMASPRGREAARAHGFEPIMEPLP